MNDERFERELRETLLEDAGPGAPDMLRARISTIPDGAPARRSRVLLTWVMTRGLAAAAVSVLVGSALLLTRPAVGPAPSPEPSPEPVPSASATLSPPTVAPEPPGQSWALVPATGALSDAALVGVIANAGGFVAVGDTGSTPDAATAWTSPDGMTWTKRSMPPNPVGSSHVSGLVAGGPGLVAIGSITTSLAAGGDAALVWTSSDGGITWTATELPQPTGSQVPFGAEAIASGPDRIVILGACEPVAPGPACPRSRFLWQSTDGRDWRVVEFPEQDVSLSTVVAGGSGFLIGGARNASASGDAAIWTSPDGRSWASVGDLPDGAGVPGEPLPVNAIGVGPDRIIALSGHAGMGVRARAWSSGDGRTWRLVADLSDRWFGIGSAQPLWTSSGFLAVGWTAPDVAPPAHPDLPVARSRTILHSTDGSTWDPLIQPPLPEGSRLTGLADGGDRIVAVGSGLGGAIVLVSPANLVTPVPGPSPGPSESTDGAATVCDEAAAAAVVPNLQALAVVRAYEQARAEGAGPTPGRAQQPSRKRAGSSLNGPAGSQTTTRRGVRPSWSNPPPLTGPCSTTATWARSRRTFAPRPMSAGPMPFGSDTRASMRHRPARKA